MRLMITPFTGVHRSIGVNTFPFARGHSIMPLPLINISLLVNEPADSVLKVVLPESFIDRAIFDENTSTFLLASCVPLTEVVCSRFDLLDALGLKALLAAPVQHLVLLVHEWSTFSVDIFDIVGAIVDELVHHFLRG